MAKKAPWAGKSPRGFYKGTQTFPSFKNAKNTGALPPAFFRGKKRLFGEKPRTRGISSREKSPIFLRGPLPKGGHLEFIPTP